MYQKDIIYQALQDEESRMIFQQRIGYSTSKDETYVVEMVHRLVERYAEEDSLYRLLRWLACREDRKIVIFGAGCGCRHLLWILKTYSIKVDYICDNNSTIHGKYVHGKLVISPEQLTGMLDKCSIIVGVNWYAEEICRQLKEMGTDENNIFVPEHGWWLGRERQYFDSHIVKPAEEEVFVDGGAFSGEDTQAFFAWSKGQKDKAYILEPDRNNFQKCIENLNQYAGNLRFYNQGLWSESRDMAFSDSLSAASSVGENGNTIIQTIAIDDLPDSEQISFIKMDIEGAELEALKGAADTIKRNKPKLAICVYHKPEDIIDIPSKILELNPSYKLFLRHYSYLNTETVLYAVE